MPVNKYAPASMPVSTTASSYSSVGKQPLVDSFSVQAWASMAAFCGLCYLVTSIPNLLSPAVASSVQAVAIVVAIILVMLVATNLLSAVCRPLPPQWVSVDEQCDTAAASAVDA